MRYMYWAKRMTQESRRLERFAMTIRAGMARMVGSCSINGR